ncbi:N-6 DNA methylase [Pseudomonas kuykendallii]|uniref:N-6 DNA Methylase n=1 Tax=Pseudomonas kuykendallii TaxID=1007099 RepID=A0A1H3EP83_9PSED|nr:N-6 DNA methylase [Pseudomonas kuykendallii]MCQ4271035.1 N-6 DNA methylase [Pseudomonas kuykendallii]SDX79759.1 N-6 DNA Methylase [Pseudomonas kuykendallii]
MTAAANSVPGNPAAHRKSLIKLLDQASRRRHLWEVFGDFVEMGALAMSNSVNLTQFAEREARYLALIQRYEPDEQKLFPKMLGELVLAIEYGPDDVLGRVFGELDLGNAARGQFFTPYEVCVAMARLQVGDGADLRQRIQQRGFIRLNEPAAGAGALVIAMAEAMQHQHINYQQHLHVIAQDVDSRAVHMAYLQLSLLHIPAVVILGNTLALEEREHWYTPAHILGLWGPKLRRGYALGSAMDERQDEPAPPPEPEPAPPYIPQPLPATGAQMALF